MSQSWRITINENNQSAVAIPTVGNIGATVIRSYRGPTVPVKIARGGEQRILNIFGTPSASYPDIWDAIEYNKKADLWISAPVAANALKGGVIVTSEGTKGIFNGVDSEDNIDFTAIPLAEELGIGDGSTTSFSMTLGEATYYVNQTIKLYVDGVSINVSATNAATEVLSTAPNVGSGTYVRSTGVLTFTFTSAPAINSVITAVYEGDLSTIAYFALLSKNAQDDFLATKITATGGVFAVNLYSRSTSGSYSAVSNSPYSASITPNAKDGFGKNIFVEEVFADDDYVVAVANDLITTFTSFVNDTSNVLFTGGDRGSAITITQLQTGWNYFQSSNKYPADIFFDCTADAGVPAIFETLRGTYQKYSAYLLPLPNSNPATGISNRQSLATSNRGIYFYWGYGKVRDNYNNSFLWSPLMGRVAGKHADMVNVYNGLAPSWIDENGHGGQLGSGIVEMAYDATEGELQAFDEAQINPIVFDNNYGVMIVGDRTSYTTLSDYSYIGHSRVADYIISNVIKQALPYQLTKLNDITHRALVKSKCDAIVSPLVPAPYNLLREYLVKCDEKNNNDEVLAARRFVVEILVKFTPFSETITFIFTNVAQGVSVTEVAGQ